MHEGRFEISLMPCQGYQLEWFQGNVVPLAGRCSPARVPDRVSADLM